VKNELAHKDTAVEQGAQGARVSNARRDRGGCRAASDLGKNMAKVRARAPDDLDTDAAVLTDAFVDEAGLNYWLKQDATKVRRRRKFFDAVLGNMLHPKREVYVAESGSAMTGAAIWLGPGLKAFDFPWWRELYYTPLFLRSRALPGCSGLRTWVRD
jgi:hypothetical protein